MTRMAGATEDSPLISVGVTAHRTELYLGDALESLLRQEGVRQEIIVVVDGPDDPSYDVARGFGSRRVVAVQHERNRGVCAARNTAIGLARGEYLMFLDGDDLRTGTDSVAALLAALRAAPELGMVFGMVRQFLCPLISEERRATLLCPPGITPAIHAGGMLIRRDAMQRVGPFDPVRRMGDFLEWMLRANEAGIAHRVIDRLVMERRIHGENTSLQRAAVRGGEYALAIKQSLDRRRQGLPTG